MFDVGDRFLDLEKRREFLDLELKKHKEKLAIRQASCDQEEIYLEARRSSKLHYILKENKAAYRRNQEFREHCGAICHTSGFQKATNYNGEQKQLTEQLNQHWEDLLGKVQKLFPNYLPRDQYNSLVRKIRDHNKSGSIHQYEHNRAGYQNTNRAAMLGGSSMGMRGLQQGMGSFPIGMGMEGMDMGMPHIVNTNNRADVHQSIDGRSWNSKFRWSAQGVANNEEGDIEMVHGGNQYQDQKDNCDIVLNKLCTARNFEELVREIQKDTEDYAKTSTDKFMSKKLASYRGGAEERGTMPMGMVEKSMPPMMGTLKFEGSNLQNNIQTHTDPHPMILKSASISPNQGTRRKSQQGMPQNGIGGRQAGAVPSLQDPVELSIPKQPEYIPSKPQHVPQAGTAAYESYQKLRKYELEMRSDLDTLEKIAFEAGLGNRMNAARGQKAGIKGEAQMLSQTASKRDIEKERLDAMTNEARQAVSEQDSYQEKRREEDRQFLKQQREFLERDLLKSHNDLLQGQNGLQNQKAQPSLGTTSMKDNNTNQELFLQDESPRRHNTRIGIPPLGESKDTKLDQDKSLQNILSNLDNQSREILLRSIRSISEVSPHWNHDLTLSLSENLPSSITGSATMASAMASAMATSVKQVLQGCQQGCEPELVKEILRSIEHRSSVNNNQSSSDLMNRHIDLKDITREEGTVLDSIQKSLIQEGRSLLQDGSLNLTKDSLVIKDNMKDNINRDNATSMKDRNAKDHNANDAIIRGMVDNANESTGDNAMKNKILTKNNNTTSSHMKESPLKNNNLPKNNRYEMQGAQYLGLDMVQNPILNDQGETTNSSSTNHNVKLRASAAENMMPPIHEENQGPAASSGASKSSNSSGGNMGGQPNPNSKGFGSATKRRSVDTAFKQRQQEYDKSETSELMGKEGTSMLKEGSTLKEEMFAPAQILAPGNSELSQTMANISTHNLSAQKDALSPTQVALNDLMGEFANSPHQERSRSCSDKGSQDESHREGSVHSHHQGKASFHDGSQHSELGASFGASALQTNFKIPNTTQVVNTVGFQGTVESPNFEMPNTNNKNGSGLNGSGLGVGMSGRPSILDLPSDVSSSNSLNKGGNYSHNVSGSSGSSNNLKRDVINTSNSTGSNNIQHNVQHDESLRAFSHSNLSNTSQHDSRNHSATKTDSSAVVEQKLLNMLSSAEKPGNSFQSGINNSGLQISGLVDSDASLARFEKQVAEEQKLLEQIKWGEKEKENHGQQNKQKKQQQNQHDSLGLSSSDDEDYFAGLKKKHLTQSDHREQEDNLSPPLIEQKVEHRRTQKLEEIQKPARQRADSLEKAANAENGRVDKMVSVLEGQPFQQKQKKIRSLSELSSDPDSPINAAFDLLGKNNSKCPREVRGYVGQSSDSLCITGEQGEEPVRQEDDRKRDLVAEAKNFLSDLGPASSIVGGSASGLPPLPPAQSHQNTTEIRNSLSTASIKVVGQKNRSEVPVLSLDLQETEMTAVRNSLMEEEREKKRSASPSMADRKRMADEDFDDILGMLGEGGDDDDSSILSSPISPQLPKGKKVREVSPVKLRQGQNQQNPDPMMSSSSSSSASGFPTGHQAMKQNQKRDSKPTTFNGGVGGGIGGENLMTSTATGSNNTNEQSLSAGPSGGKNLDGTTLTTTHDNLTGTLTGTQENLGPGGDQNLMGTRSDSSKGTVPTKKKKAPPLGFGGGLGGSLVGGGGSKLGSEIGFGKSQTSVGTNNTFAGTSALGPLGKNNGSTPGGLPRSGSGSPAGMYGGVRVGSTSSLYGSGSTSSLYGVNASTKSKKTTGISMGGQYGGLKTNLGTVTGSSNKLGGGVSMADSGFPEDG